MHKLFDLPKKKVIALLRLVLLVCNKQLIDHTLPSV